MKNTKTLVLYGLLTAIIALMAFTPIGYLKTPLIEITFLTIPVIVGAIVLGPAGGAFLGGVFGITSFLQCFGMSPFGAQLLAINPILTFITCLVPRILMGLCSGLIFKFLKNKKNIIPYFAASTLGAVFNTVFFMLFLMLLFGNTEFIKNMQGGRNILSFVVFFVGINGLIEAVVAAIAGTAISSAVYKFSK